MTDLSKNSVTQRVVTEDEEGQRLDNFLLKICKGVPKSHVYRILRSGEVRVNRRRADAAYRLQIGDVLRLPPVRIAQGASQENEAVLLGAARGLALPVLYEDEALLVVDKPSGLAVHGGSGVSFGVIELLRRQRPQAKFLELAHRLDRETSGILLVAKKRSALVVLHDMFRRGAVGEADKRYLVLVKGRWMDPLRHVRLPLFKYLLDSGERRVRVAEQGKESHTVFRLLARWQGFSLLEAELKTGRTHQIRVHLAHLGYPIVGDEKYGDFALNKTLEREGLKRMFLHAWKMVFAHPVSALPLSFEAVCPDALVSFVQKIATKEQQDYGVRPIASWLGLNSSSPLSMSLCPGFEESTAETSDVERC
ncbi:MAG: RluA family pseudouridine synthase [Pseudomonadota bacterium]